MKKCTRWTLRLGLAAFLLTGAVAAQAQAAGDLSVDDIIAKSVETRGGMDALKAVETMRMKGTMSMGPGMEAPFTITYKRPNRVRMEFTVQGMKAIQAYDGEAGWGVMPFMGKTEPEPLAGDDLKMLEELADIDGPMVDYRDKGHAIEFEGTEDVEGTEAYKLKITKDNGDIHYSFLDTELFLEFRQQGKRTVQGTELDIVSNIGDYKDVGDILLPFSIEQKMGEFGTQTIAIDSIDVGVDVEDDFFVMPEVEEAAEGE